MIFCRYVVHKPLPSSNSNNSPALPPKRSDRRRPGQNQRPSDESDICYHVWTDSNSPGGEWACADNPLVQKRVFIICTYYITLTIDDIAARPVCNVVCR